MSDDVRYQPRFGVDIRVKPDTHEEPVKRHCDRPNCEAEGRYRAPKGPDVLNQYYWFCLDHVREYNLSWDYFRGMKPEEIDAYQREALTGHRPTWKLGDRNAGTIKSERLHAIFGINEPYRILEDGPGRPAPERTRKPL
ncbi:MAG TPA: molecular chaperone DnaJ, partial [Alphaproteobacteria bacterium]|nr:molecular chaperone DnaJ [Alphaproteobacteria bacterium]